MGVNSMSLQFGSLQNIVQQMDQIISKYQHNQLSKFISIATADLTNDEAAVSQLIDSFVDDEKANFDLFLDDFSALEDSNIPTAQLLLQLNKKHIEKIDADISSAEQQRDAIIHKYKGELATALGNVTVSGAKQNVHTYDSSASSSSSAKKHGRCTIF